MSRIVVAGAGQRGLRCAGLLADSGLDVSLVERLPAPGGQEPEPSIREFARSVEESGVRFMLANLAVGLSAHTLRILGVEGSDRIPCDVLVVATGTRPATRGELRIGGDRCAGVMPGSAMVHLLEVGVLPGYRPLVYGTGERALHCAELLARAGAVAVTLVGSDHPSREPRAPARLLVPYTVGAIHGTSRVTGASLRSVNSEGSVEVPTDAVILAAEERPMRNIEGAIVDSPRVVFCQATVSGSDAEATARQAAEEVVASVQGAGPPRDDTTGRERGELCKH